LEPLFAQHPLWTRWNVKKPDPDVIAAEIAEDLEAPSTSSPRLRLI
jgi:hypothetical protein